MSNDQEVLAFLYHAANNRRSLQFLFLLESVQRILRDKNHSFSAFHFFTISYSIRLKQAVKGLLTDYHHLFAVSVNDVFLRVRSFCLPNL
jgi:hypothetical protein